MTDQNIAMYLLCLQIQVSTTFMMTFWHEGIVHFNSMIESLAQLSPLQYRYSEFNHTLIAMVKQAPTIVLLGLNASGKTSKFIIAFQVAQNEKL